MTKTRKNYVRVNEDSFDVLVRFVKKALGIGYRLDKRTLNRLVAINKEYLLRKIENIK